MIVLIALDYQQGYYLAVNLNLLNFYFDTRSLRSLKRKEKVRNQATFAQKHPFFLYCLRDVYPLLNNELLKGTTVNILRNVFNVWILPFTPKYQNSNSHLLSLYIFNRNSEVSLLKYQLDSSCVIMSFILMITLFYKTVILQGEING